MRDDRQRNWSFVVYPESVNLNWRSILDDFHIEWCESPLHDKDINEGTGELKKPHIHICITFDGKKTFEQIKEITDELNAPIPQRVKSVKGLIRYFIHIDNPEKYQYNKDSIIPHGGFDYEQYFKVTATDRYDCIRQMIDFIKQNNITEVIDFTEYAMTEHYTDWFPLLCDNSMLIIKENIISNAYKLGKRK